MNIVGQVSGGVRTSTTNHYGQNIYNIFERGPIFRSTTGSGGDINGWNFMFNIPSANTNHPLIITKGDSYFDNVYFWIHNGGTTVSGDAGYFSTAYKFNAKPLGGQKAFFSGDWNASNNTILYTSSFGHSLTSGAGASGMGAGFDFVADNASNTLTSIADIAGVWNGTPTAGAENGDIIARGMRNGTLTEIFRAYGKGGFAPTIMSAAQQAAISSPATGIMLFNTDSSCISVYNGSGFDYLGKNIGNSNLSVTGNRILEVANNDLTIRNVKNLNINSLGTFNSRTQYGQILTSPSNGAFPWQTKYGMLNAAGLSDSITAIIVQNVSGITLSSTESGTAKSGIVDIGTDGVVSITGDSVRAKLVPHSGVGLPDSVLVAGYRQLTGDATQLGASTLYAVPRSALLTNVVQTLNSQYTTAQNSGTTETDLYTYTLPANKLDADGKSMSFEIDGEVNDNTATAQIKLYFAGNTTLNTGAVNIVTGATAYKITGKVTRTSSTTAHVTYHMKALGLATDEFLSYNNLTSLDFTSTNVFKITAQAGGAGGGNGDITAHSWEILYKP